MKVGLVVDTFSIEAGTGIARYCQELLSGLSRLDLCVRSLCFPPPRLPFGTVAHHTVKMPYMILRQASQLDLIHATNPACMFGLSLTRKPTVVTYHDLVSLMYKDTGHAWYTRLLVPLYFRMGKFIDKIIADSSQTKKDLATRLGISESKITVVNLGVDRAFRPMNTEPHDGYVIGYVGALYRRKRLDYLLRAFRLLKEMKPRTPLKLVICGSEQLEYAALVKQASELGIAGDVEFRGFIAEDELVKVYNSFDIFVLPSECEGFGMPILEAQRCGVPVAIREDAHIPHEVSKCCLKVKSEKEMADKMWQVLVDSDLRSATIKAGLEYSRQFTWENTVKATLDIYQEAML